MKNMQILLNEAENEWRTEVRKDFPLWGNTPIVRNTKPSGRDWTFSTDLKKIYAHISNDKALQEKFKTIVAKFWNGNPEELARETLHYLLFHELYHPIEAPFSVVGENNDSKKIHQAIRRGIIVAEPKLSPLEQIIKVQASTNMVEDFILDNRLFLDNLVREYFQRDIIPTWDLLELQDNPSKTNAYTITRLIYGLMYGPQSTHDFFEEKAGKEGHNIAEKSLTAIIGKPVQLSAKKIILGKAKALLLPKSEQKAYEQLQEYVKAVRGVFSSEDRYKGIERFMAVLGPYVEKGMPQRADMLGEGSGSSPQNILQDLLEDMAPSEQEQFIQGLAQENESTLEQAASQMTKKPDVKQNSDSIDEMKNLDVLAAHEFYQRNHPKVLILGGKKIGESMVVGKQEYWNLKNSTVLTEDQLSRVNLRRIDILQKRTRLPWLIPLGNGTYRLNEYEFKQRDIKDIVYVDKSIDVPEVLEFYLDSSGSMFTGYDGRFKVNDGTRWDMLSHVLYGFIDALQQGGKQLGKQSRIRIHNFASAQKISEFISVDKFWKGNGAALRVLFKPENGGSSDALDINTTSTGRKTAYVICTDGELSNYESEAEKMRRLGKDKQNHVVLFEIGGTYGLGNCVRNDPNIAYHQVHDKEKMLQAGLEVLLSK